MDAIMDVRKYAVITFSRHARDQMRQRLIGEELIERTILQPDRTRESTTPPERIIAERVTAAGNTIRAVFVELDGRSRAHVVTVIRIGGKRQ